MTIQCNYLSLDDSRVVWLQLCIKNNSGFFYTDYQKDFTIGNVTRSEDNNRIMHKRFPSATWHTNFKFKIPVPKGPIIDYKMVGDELGVLAKLKLANKKEQATALENGYVVVWERPAPASFDDQLAKLVEDASCHIKRADYLIEKKAPTLKTMDDQLIKMVRWNSRVEFLTKQDRKYVVDDGLREAMEQRFNALHLRYSLVRGRENPKSPHE